MTQLHASHTTSNSNSNSNGNSNSNTGRDNTSSPIISSLNSAYIADAPVDTTTDFAIVESAEEQNKSKSYLDDGFIFGLEGSGISRPKGKVAQLVVEGDSLETTPYQIAVVAATFTSHTLFAMNSIAQLSAINHGNTPLTIIQTIATLLSSCILADLGSGILHFSVDNYGNGRTPIMGSIIASFQGHHSAAWTITERGFCNNVYKLCVPFGIPTVAAISLIAGPSHPIVSLFFTIFCSMEILSQEFHKWSHMTVKQLNPVILGMQRMGLTLDRTPHAKHHLAPYKGNYCIVSGFCNKFLDESGFFRRLERVIYDINGVESNSWKLDAELKAKTLSGDYSL
jgi:hypothetical protein